MVDTGPEFSSAEYSVTMVVIPCVCVCAVLRCAESLRSRLTLCDPLDCSPPGSSAHGILRARTLAAAAAAKSLQSCPTLFDPIDGSPPGSPVPGILQARTLEGLPFPSPMHESEK